MAVEDIERIVDSLLAVESSISDAKAGVCEDTWKALLAVQGVVRGFLGDLQGMADAQDESDGAVCERCGGPMVSLGWLDLERCDLACPKCDRETLLKLGYDPEEL